MSKFAATATTARPYGPLAATGPAVTHEGGAGFQLDDKSALFTLAVSNMVAEDTFYETGPTRDRRFADLVHAVTRSDPAWMQGFVPWLRTGGLMRSASVVAAAEYAAAGGPGARSVINSACARADEPAEMLAYWMATHGRQIPSPVKRGIADAATRLYSQQTPLKYDSSRSALRPGDVIELCHPAPKDDVQSAVFRHLIDRRHNRPAETYVGVPLELAAAYAFDAVPTEERRQYLAEHGLPALYTWERLSGWLPGGMDAAGWESVIPQMGYMALLRNLRNFEGAKVAGEVLNGVAQRLSDPVEVAKSRQCPLRFLSAWVASQSMTFGPALEAAVEASTANVPALTGRTLVMLDRSGSMEGSLSARSEVRRWQAAAVFAGSLAKRSRVDVVPYDTQTYGTHSSIGSVLRFAAESKAVGGGGTSTWGCTAAAYDGHDRIVIITDEQSADSQSATYSCPVYVWNLGGYGVTTIDPGRGRYVLGGLTDAAFRLIPLLERGADAPWPWMV